jgi:hypothetical protein
MVTRSDSPRVSQVSMFFRCRPAKRSPFYQITRRKPIGRTPQIIAIIPTLLSLFRAPTTHLVTLPRSTLPPDRIHCTALGNKGRWHLRCLNGGRLLPIIISHTHSRLSSPLTLHILPFLHPSIRRTLFPHSRHLVPHLRRNEQPVASQLVARVHREVCHLHLAPTILHLRRRQRHRNYRLDTMDIMRRVLILRRSDEGLVRLSQYSDCILPLFVDDPSVVFSLISFKLDTFTYFPVDYVV